ncbi:MAG: ribonuclease Y [Planctomycetia bacterium]|nr:ribonuclease Y [Planctomycetia bacterium]
MGSIDILTSIVLVILATLASGAGVYWFCRRAERAREKKSRDQAQIICADAQQRAEQLVSDAQARVEKIQSESQAIIEQRRQRAEEDASRIIQQATEESKQIRRQAELEAINNRREAELELKEEQMRQKEALEQQKRETQRELIERERSLDKRQEQLDAAVLQIQRQETDCAARARELEQKIVAQDALEHELHEKIERQDRILYETANLTREQAVDSIMKKLDRELIDEQGALILRHEKSVQRICDDQARNYILQALQRYAASHTAESTTSSVDIPSDDMKGRVIGREGRNIRAFERVTGVDVIIDDTPGVIIVSAFDPIRREVAKLTLKRLIDDGRIHPSRIEEIYAQTERELQIHMRHAGTEACQLVEAHGMNDRIVALLGRLSFRTSYSQNVLDHSIEVAFISGMIAAELGLNERLARRCGLLHDIGKAIDHEMEGGHPQLGANVLKRFGEPKEVVQAALMHHEDLRAADPYTTIVSVADVCSASRPGARRETLEHYINRMEELEHIAMSFPYVEQAYAVQAGREMRVLVNSQLTSDESAAKTCRDIVAALKAQLQFPGEIKVTVIRETRTTEIAK